MVIMNYDAYEFIYIFMFILIQNLNNQWIIAKTETNQFLIDSLSTDVD